MKQLFKTIKTYVYTIYKVIRCKKSIVVYIKKDNTFGLTFFNMSEEEAREYLYLSFDHFAFKHIVQNEIERITK